MKTTHLAFLIVLLGFASSVASYSSDLPSEKTLPAKPGAVGISVNLPPESDLPIKKSVAATVAPEARTLPSESELPIVFQEPKLPNPPALPDISDALTKEVSARGDLETELFKEEGETTPWARLIQDGHASTVTAIAFSPDGQMLYTAGRDKLVHEWSLDENQKWTHRDTVRWQVGRGPSGQISSVLATNRFLFLSGYGVKAGREIGVIDRNMLTTLGPLLNTNDLTALDTGVLADVSTSDETRIVAGDLHGGLERWNFDRQTGLWTPTRLRKSSQPRTGQNPLARVGDSKVVIPTRVGPTTNLAWQLDVIDIRDGKNVEILNHDASPANGLEILGAMFEDLEKSSGIPLPMSEKSDIVKKVIPLSNSICQRLVSSPTGKFIAALDDQRWLYIWETGKGMVLKYRQQEVVGKAVREAPFDFTCIAWTDSDQSFLVGEKNIKTGQGRMQKWTLNAAGQFRKEASLEIGKAPIHLSVKGQLFAIDSGPQIQVRRVNDLSVSGELGRNSLRAPKQIQWRMGERIGWRWSDARSLDAPAEGAEHAMGIVNNEKGESRLQLLDASQFQWLPQPNFLNGELPKEDGAGSFSLRLPGIGAATLELAVDPGESVSNYNGRISASAWILDSNEKPTGVAVCFVDATEIWVFGFPPQGSRVCPLWRMFRGHEDTINALQCSRDGRYLLSSCQDRRISIWPLTGWDAAREAKFDPMARWGLKADIGADGIDVIEVAPEGPLYSRGVRTGDRIVKLAWTEPSPTTGKLEAASTEVSEEIWRRLGQANFITNFAFWYHRGGPDAPRQGFKRVCQWEPLLTVAANTEREWAAWTPLGFYDASFNGDQLFGWQLNRGPDKRPDFLPANRFRASLERPDVIGKLLEAGNIVKAFEKVAVQIPGGPNGVLTSLVALQPSVDIVSPTAGTALKGNQVRLRATAKVQMGQTIISSRAFVNGVVATAFRWIGPPQGTVDPADPDKRLFVLEWDAAVPSDRRLKFQVFVETAERNLGVGEFVLDRAMGEREMPSPSVYVVTAGVSQYRDPSLNLAKPSINAKRIAETFSTNAIRKNNSRFSVLTDSMVTPIAWRSTIETMAERLQDNVSPDDIVVIYLTGHGVIDAITQEYHFVTSRALTRDLRASKYEDCLSLTDLKSLRKVACRKLVILDTCHSGAAQSQSPSRLKQAVRSLQDDQIFVLTASEGNQLAFEDAFTEPLKEALEGKADADRDQFVTLRETFQYVKEKMKKQTKPQYPTLGPTDLIDYVDFSIVRTRSTEKLTSAIADPLHGTYDALHVGQPVLRLTPSTTEPHASPSP